MQAYFASPTAHNVRPVSATLNQIRYWKQIQTATDRFNRMSSANSKKSRRRPELRLNERSASKLMINQRKGLQTPQVAVASLVDIRSTHFTTPLANPN